MQEKWEMQEIFIISRIKKWEIAKKFSLLSRFFCIYYFMRQFFSLCKKARNVMCKKWEMQKMREIMRYKKSCFSQFMHARNTRKREKFKKCDNYCTCLSTNHETQKEQSVDSPENYWSSGYSSTVTSERSWVRIPRIQILHHFVVTLHRLDLG